MSDKSFSPKIHINCKKHFLILIIIYLYCYNDILYINNLKLIIFINYYMNIYANIIFYISDKRSELNLLKKCITNEFLNKYNKS